MFPPSFPSETTAQIKVRGASPRKASRDTSMTSSNAVGLPVLQLSPTAITSFRLLLTSPLRTTYNLFLYFTQKPRSSYEPFEDKEREAKCGKEYCPPLPSHQCRLSSPCAKRSSQHRAHFVCWAETAKGTNVDRVDKCRMHDPSRGKSNRDLFLPH